jgi:glycosyltransferase involved in cell wall biosynthesis
MRGRFVRILAVNWRDIKNPEAGGAEVHLHEILSQLVRWGHEATQISAGYPACLPEETIDGIRILRRGHWFDANFTIPLFARGHIKRNGYDVVIEDINKLPFFMPLFTGVPVVPVVPHLFGSTAFLETNALIAFYVYCMEKFIPVVFGKNHFVVISPSTKEDLVARGIGPERISVVLCGLDHDRYRYLDLERFERPTIVHLGRLRKYKSVGVALRAMARIREQLPDARLVIIGEGPHKQALEKDARLLGLGEAIEFKGYMDHEELVEFLNRSHLLINPSPKEGWGLTVVEANACGVPVVASDRPGLRDSVLDGETGFLVPYGDEEAFAEKAVHLLRNGDEWHRMSRRAIERVGELTWDRCAAEMEELLKGIIGSGA